MDYEEKLKYFLIKSTQTLGGYIRNHKKWLYNFSSEKKKKKENPHRISELYTVSCNGWHLKWDSVVLLTSSQDSVELKWLREAQPKEPGLLQAWISALVPVCCLLSFRKFSYRPRSVLAQHFSAHRTKWPSHVPTLNITFISWLLFPVRCFITTNSNKSFFFFLLLLKIFSGFCLPSVSSHVRGLYPRS